MRYQGIVRRAVVVFAAAGAMVATAVSASASVAAPAAPELHLTVSTHDAATTASAKRQVEDYWTSDRMKSATPMERGKSATTKLGVTLNSPQRKAASAAVREAPQPRLGKVFFTLGGRDYVCSGTATASANRDVVTTAGHCLNEGPGAYATNFIFVPAYNNGSAPYGKWSAYGLLAPTQWKNSGDFNYDVGFAVMNSDSSGRSLTDVVGSYPIAFNLQRGLTYKAYGYPADYPYSGEYLYSCSGVAQRDTFGGTNDHGIPCSMTGGSSGGGWLTGGRINSVNSFGYNNLPDMMFGPYFGSVIQSAYNVAANA